MKISRQLENKYAQSLHTLTKNKSFFTDEEWQKLKNCYWQFQHIIEQLKKEYES